MPKEKAEKSLCMSGLRHAEYYGMQEVFDGLYAKSSKNETFTNLMNIILKRENILLAYRNIKSNDGSKTPGTDGVTFDDIGKLMPDEVIDTVRFITIGSTHGYRPKPVRRKEIPKPYDPTKTRPLGIPCVWDRLVQQCIKQVMEPICEAKFSENSYGFRPNRSAENAIARAEFLIQNTRLHYVVEFDVKGFFDNVDHSKLIKQIWSLGIRDKNLLFVLKRILKAPIRLENGAMEFLIQADLKIQYSSPAMATGKTAFLKNSLIASVLVIGGTSIPASIIPGKSDRAQGFLKSLVKAHNLRYSSSLFRCLCGSASLGFSSRASTF